ncbi:MAG: hypothetical protein KBF69_07860, partial [Saprospiraceae bacterium]|nr:hypothetical protein [Saprospiraceae bacterium]
MKPIVQITLFSVMLMIASLGKVFGQYQDCITFHSDYSGLEWDAAERTRIITAACELNTLLTDAGVPNFKVHTFGFYGYNPNMQGGTEAVWNDFLASKVNTATPHLAIGKEINLDGSFKKFWISFSIPASNCFAQTDAVKIQNRIKKYTPSASTNPSPLSIINDCHTEIKILLCLCNSQDPSICLKDIDRKLTKELGFRKTQIEIGSNRTWGLGQNGIYDYFGKEVKIGGAAYYIPEQVNESKTELASSLTITTEDTTIVSTGINGLVYILDEESFTNGEWDNMQSAAANVGYVECWVVLKDDYGNYWLYSRFSFGPFEDPAGIVAVRGENPTGKRGVTLSPWGNALKLLGNAAIDACLQAVGNRLTDENINDWTSAFKSVSYMGAAWEGISSLLPWKKSKAASTLITAIGKGFIVVISKATSDQYYTAEQGLRDFIWAIGESVLSQIVGEKLAGKIPEAISGLVRLVGNSSGTVAKIGAKCFSTQLMKYGCFTGSTTVYTSLSSQKLIKDITLHDIVLSHGTIDRGIYADVSLLNPTVKNQPITTLNAVSFISKNGTHSCQLSLHDASLVKYDIRAIGDYAFLSIPEQGIDGIYTVTDLRKINQPKIPTDEDSSDDFVFSPVTAIFGHASDDVWKLTFENGEEVEVTSMHPFMDAVSGLWKPVALLNAGDVVKTKAGIAVLSSKEKLEGTHTVYNFTVDATHNYLVGDAGYLVHNSCGNLNKLANEFKA